MQKCFNESVISLRKDDLHKLTDIKERFIGCYQRYFFELHNDPFIRVAIINGYFRVSINSTIKCYK